MKSLRTATILRTATTAIALFFLTFRASADTALSMQQVVSGYNVYAPCVKWDAQAGKYFMWYGGWNTATNYPNDSMYRQESSDLLNWTNFQVVLYHSTIGMYHVDDPSVAKVWNPSLGAWQWWMFFTAIPCDPENTNDCSITYHRVWAGESLDGVNFTNFVQVTSDWNGQGTFSPSVVCQDISNSVFRLYYQITGPANQIIMSILTNYTTVVSSQVVFTSTNDGAHNPDVSIRPDGTWMMLYNHIDTNNDFHIWKLTSPDGLAWTNNQEILHSDCSPYCVATTPNALWVNETNYWMFWGQDVSLNDLPQGKIQAWLMSTRRRQFAIGLSCGFIGGEKFFKKRLVKFKTPS